MIENKTLIKTENLEESLVHETFISMDESQLTLKVSLNKKFVVSRDFNNNTFGLSKMEEFKQQLDTTGKFKSYLGV